MCLRRSRCWKFRKWCSYFENCCHTKIVDKTRLKNMLVCRHPTGSTRNGLVKKRFWCSFLKKTFFSYKYIILAMLTLENKVNFFLLHNFLVVRVVLTFFKEQICYFVRYFTKLSKISHSLRHAWSKSMLHSDIWKHICRWKQLKSPNFFRNMKSLTLFHVPLLGIYVSRTES